MFWLALVNGHQNIQLEKYKTSNSKPKLIASQGDQSKKWQKNLSRQLNQKKNKSTGEA